MFASLSSLFCVVIRQYLTGFTNLRNSLMVTSGPPSHKLNEDLRCDRELEIGVRVCCDGTCHGFPTEFSGRTEALADLFDAGRPRVHAEHALGRFQVW